MESMPRETPKRKADEIIGALAELFPQTFVPHAWMPHRPLKCGIRHDLAGVLTGEELHLALRWYVNRLMYQRALVAGAARVDLDGKPVGSVSEEHAAGAKHLVAKRIKRAEAKIAARQTKKPERANKSEWIAPPATPTVSRRLSLADLKAAAIARKAAVS
jgi:ProP effector